MKNNKKSYFTQNEYYDSLENSTYELLNLLLHLPEDFRTKVMSQEQLKLIAAALLHTSSVKHDVVEGLDAIGDLLGQLPGHIQADEDNSTLRLSHGTLHRLGRLLRHMSAMVFFLWQTEVSLSDVLERH